MTTMTGGDLLVEAMAREGVRKVFSIPGGQLLPIYDAIREHPSMDMVVPRHEGASALMACGYSCATGRPAVVMSTVGAGVIYEAGGLLYAWRERLPVISIAPQVQSYKMKPVQESLQACDQDEIYRPFTKFRAIMYHYGRVPQLLRRAIKTALAAEPGPVHLDMPVDVIFSYRKLDEKEYSKLFPEGNFRFEGEIPPDPKALDEAAALLEKSRRPIVLAGRCVRGEGAGGLNRLLEASSAPVLVSGAAFGSVKHDYKNRLGLAGDMDEGRALEAASEADLILLFEADEETARFAGKLYDKNPQVKVVQAAECAAAVGSVTPVDVPMVGTSGSVLGELAERVRRNPPEGLDEAWIGKLGRIKGELEEERVYAMGPAPRVEGVMGALEVINGLLSPEDYVVCEGPMAARAAALKLRHPGVGRTALIGDDYIPGAGLPLALGIKSATPAARVFLVTDTVRLKRHSRELQTAKRYELPVTGFVFQGLERKPPQEVDFSRLAQSFGLESTTIREPLEEITPEAVSKSFASRTGTLFDVSGF